MGKQTQFESWLRRTQEVAVNQFGYEPEEVDNFDLIDFGLYWEADLTPYEAVEEHTDVESRQQNMFDNE